METIKYKSNKSFIKTLLLTVLLALPITGFAGWDYGWDDSNQSGPVTGWDEDMLNNGGDDTNNDNNDNNNNNDNSNDDDWDWNNNSNYGNAGNDWWDIGTNNDNDDDWGNDWNNGWFDNNDNYNNWWDPPGFDDDPDQEPGCSYDPCVCWGIDCNDDYTVPSGQPDQPDQPDKN